MVQLKRVKSKNFTSLVTSLLKNTRLRAKNIAGLLGHVNAARFHRKEKPTFLSEKHVKVIGQYPRLVGLGDITVDTVNLRNNTAISHRKPRVLENRSGIPPVPADIVDKVPKRPLSKLHTIDSSFRPHNISHMAHSGSASRA